MLVEFNKSAIAIGITTFLILLILEDELSSQVKKSDGKGDIDQYFLHV